MSILMYFALSKIHIQKYVHANMYNNTNNFVHLYVPLWIRNFLVNMCKYVQDSLLMAVLTAHEECQQKPKGQKWVLVNYH